jgi:hypothetical protein
VLRLSLGHLPTALLVPAKVERVMTTECHLRELRASRA